MVSTNKPVISGVRSSTSLNIAIVAGMLAVLGYVFVSGRPGTIGELVQENLGDSLTFFLSVQFVIGVPFIFLLERLFPARPEVPGFSASVVMDALYMMLHLPVIAGVLVALSGPITDFLDERASAVVVDSTRSWPAWLAVLVGVAIGDLGVWFTHMLKHKVPLFWRFHMIHHSQVNMNLFTANRTHPIDALIEHFILVVPFFFLFPAIPEQAGSLFLLGLLSGWWVRFQHANIRTDLGPLRYFMVTPQSHRIHHSIDPAHWNSNYANIFAWDRLLGTQHKDHTAYPSTGIGDPDFPEPSRLSIGDLCSSFVGQMLFPFDRAAVRRATVGRRVDTGQPPVP